MTMSPTKVFVEVTTRCNLTCAMCVKQTPGCDIVSMDMSQEIFSKLLPAFSHAREIFLNGVGEPLLHPHLEDFIRLAKQHAPNSARIGFQTNGQLLTTSRAEALMAAGLNKICVSVDSITPALLKDMRAGASLHGVNRAMACLMSAENNIKPSVFDKGIEFVLTQNNAEELPDVIRWAAEHNVSFVLVTHVLPYDQNGEAISLFNSNTHVAMELFRKHDERARLEGVDLRRYWDIFCKFLKTEEDKDICNRIKALVDEARQHQISLNIRSLLTWDETRTRLASRIFDEARTEAERLAIKLHLPSIEAVTTRRCDFVEDKGVFIAAPGTVHPCYFLWHSYTCYLNSRAKRVNACSMGDLHTTPLLDIWNDPEYVLFRETVSSYEYPDCAACNIVPCDDITGEKGPFEHDCYGVHVPCGQCPWCSDGYQCLH